MKGLPPKKQAERWNLNLDAYHLKNQLNHFLANNLDSAENARDGARIRDYVAAFDRFSAPKQGEHF